MDSVGWPRSLQECYPPQPFSGAVGMIDLTDYGIRKASLFWGVRPLPQNHDLIGLYSSGMTQGALLKHRERDTYCCGNAGSLKQIPSPLKS